MSEIKADKGWSIKASDGVSLRFTPVFVVQGVKEGETKIAGNQEVECTMINVKIRDRNGLETTMDIGFQEMYMFLYYCANEEMRQNLMLRVEKQITEIPYEITFKLDKGEKETGMAKRLIKLPVDEITMAIARSEAQLFAGKANLSTMNDWFRKRTDLRKRSNKLLESK